MTILRFRKPALAVGVLALLLTGCANIPRDAGRINLITTEEARAAGCIELDKAGSVSAILINGKARNTAVILKKALRVPGATHISYTKGVSGWTNARAFVWACPDPTLKTKDPATREMSVDYLGHE